MNESLPTIALLFACNGLQGDPTGTVGEIRIPEVGTLVPKRPLRGFSYTNKKGLRLAFGRRHFSLVAWDTHVGHPAWNQGTLLLPEARRLLAYAIERGYTPETWTEGGPFDDLVWPPTTPSTHDLTRGLLRERWTRDLWRPGMRYIEGISASPTGRVGDQAPPHNYVPVGAIPDAADRPTFLLILDHLEADGRVVSNQWLGIHRSMRLWNVERTRPALIQYVVKRLPVPGAKR